MNLREELYLRVFAADRALRGMIEPGTSVLDVGASTGTGSVVLDEARADAVDIHLPSLRQAVTSGRRRRPVVADIRKLPYRTGSFDVVVALDVIEHLERPDGERLLGEMERLSRRFVVVLTPNGFFPQAAKPGQPWFAHLSGWDARDFDCRGYAVEGAGGAAIMRHGIDRAPFRWGAIGKAIGAVSVLPTRHAHRHAFAVLAIRDAARAGGDVALAGPHRPTTDR